MITLTLLHPLQPVPVQSWTFKNEPKISIGRSTSNEVVLYSAVVSRHHVEIRKVADEWELVNLGANGTYVDGKRITKTLVVDGMIMRLASSGPKILIKIESASEPEEDTSEEQKRSKTRRLKDTKNTLIN
ncbi:MAG: FHA domain-containing protein [Xenococcaceae cyanobacterium MO_188.B32]|nr:FHA domain-containing protein [Xenococcaceae cyanobacterium MO_188.B32]